MKCSLGVNAHIKEMQMKNQLGLIKCFWSGLLKGELM